MKKNKKAPFEQCEAIHTTGVRCEQNKHNHVQNFGYQKHNAKGVGFWTDKGQERSEADKNNQNNP
jgi:hypothetical protein